LQLESAQRTPTLAYGLTYGVDLLPAHPIEAARSGAVGQVPLIIGTNSHEASMFAWGKPPMLPTTRAGIHAFFARTDPRAESRVLAAYPEFPRRSALIAIGSDVMFGAPTWAFADAYSAHAPTHAYRFDHTTWTLKVLGLGATHGSEIVHIQHSYSSYLGRKLHPLGRRVQPSVGRRMQRTWLDFATAEGPAREEDRIFPAREEDRIFQDWPRYDTDRRLTRVIRSTRDETVSDPDTVRRTAWEGLY
jgi:para-nitrobenzyl esterase